MPAKRSDLPSCRICDALLGQVVLGTVEEFDA